MPAEQTVKERMGNLSLAAQEEVFATNNIKDSEDQWQ